MVEFLSTKCWVQAKWVVGAIDTVTNAARHATGYRYDEAMESLDNFIWELEKAPERPAVDIIYFRGRVGTAKELLKGHKRMDALRELLDIEDKLIGHGFKLVADCECKLKA